MTGYPQDSLPLTERFEARDGGAAVAATELAEAMRHFVACTLPLFYVVEPDGGPAPEPRRSRLSARFVPDARPAYY